MFIFFTVRTNIGPDGSKFEVMVTNIPAATDMISILEKSASIDSYECNMLLKEMGISPAMLSKYKQQMP